MNETCLLGEKKNCIIIEIINTQHCFWALCFNQFLFNHTDPEYIKDKEDEEETAEES
jgi:hypothetical protein